MSASLLIAPRAQFFTSNGQPLAGGTIWTYQAGTTTPQAAYTDASGATAAANPIVLDAGGSASIWLGASAYKIVAQDVNGVQQWSVDNVSSVSQAQLQALSSLASLGVTGNLTVGGNETVGGSVTAGSLSVTGAGSIAGNLTTNALTASGDVTCNAALNVNGATSLGTTTAGTLTAGATTVSSLSVGAQTLAQFVASQIPALTALSGSLVMSNFTASNGWVVFTFGTTTGTRTQLAFGAGTAANGAAIALPSGFSSANFYGTVSMNNVNDSGGNGFDGFTCSLSGLTVTATGKDNQGHTYNGTANWFGVAWNLSF
jgi:hypothetical protein